MPTTTTTSAPDLSTGGSHRRALLRPGSIVAGCRIETVAGQGGMGVVYRARQLALDRPVALKVIAFDLATDHDVRVRFMREVQLAAAVEHPHVVPVYEAGNDGGHLYLLMRWIEGSDLAATLGREGSLAPERAARVLDQIASALDAVHARGLVHGDVKPRNILLEGEHAYLTDFGIAGPLGSRCTLMADGRWVGTPGYAAPEQRHAGPLDARSDVYSLGCLLVAMLTGQPLRPAVPTAAGNVRARSMPPAIGAAPDAFADVLRRALADEPALRFASAGALAAAASAAAGATAARRSPHGFNTGRACRPVPAAEAEATAAKALVQGPLRRSGARRRGRKRRRSVRSAAATLAIAVAVVTTFPTLKDELQSLRDTVEGETTIVDAPLDPPARAPDPASGTPVPSTAPPPKRASRVCVTGDVILIGTVSCRDARQVHGEYASRLGTLEDISSVDGILGSWRCSPVGSTAIVRCNDAATAGTFSAFLDSRRDLRG